MLVVFSDTVLIVTSSSTNAGAMLASELTLTLMLYLTLATLTLTASTTLPTLATLTLAMLALAMFTLTTLPLAMLSLTIRIPYSNNEPRTLVWQVVVTTQQHCPLDSPVDSPRWGGQSTVHWTVQWTVSIFTVHPVKAVKCALFSFLRGEIGRDWM